MESLRESINQLIQNTLAMEGPRVTALHNEGIYSHSQPMYEDSLTEEIPKIDQQAPEKSQDFSPKDKIVNRHKIRYTATRIKYSSTRIKSRHFLSNISYTGISKSYFYNENFILDVFVLIVKNLNPFSLSRKITDKTKHEMVYMLWRECVPSEFYRYICEEKNFLYLNSRDVGQPTMLEIVSGFIDQEKQNLRMLQEYLAQYKDIYQYVYSHVFLEVYTTSEKRGFDLKSNFHILFKAYHDKQKIRQYQPAKNPANFEQQNETNASEEKPIKNFDPFTDSEEREVKEHAEKRLAERREKTE